MFNVNNFIVNFKHLNVHIKLHQEVEVHLF